MVITIEKTWMFKMPIDKVKITTTDNAILDGEIHQHPNAIATVVIHGATGVPHGYYRNFADWLSVAYSCNVLIYAYRDSELTSAAKMRASKASMSDWGVHDQSAALNFMLDTYPDLPIHTIGHSLGGMCLPYHERADQVSTHTAVNAGPAFWRDHPLHYIPLVILFWFVLGPVFTKLFGYLPGKLIGLKSNLPSNVYWQWRRWCTNRSFFEIDWGKELERPIPGRATMPVRLVSSADDVMIPPAKVSQLARYFPDSKTSYRCIEPSFSGIKTIGHIGIFSSRCREVWPVLARQVSNSIVQSPDFAAG